MKQNIVSAAEAAMRRIRSPLKPPERLRYHAANDAPPAAGEPVFLRDGTQLVLRPIHPGDVDALQRGFSHLSAEEVRLRFLHAMRELPAELAERLCRLDAEHEIALVLVDPPDIAPLEIHAVARAYIDPVTATAEFALVVQKRYTGQGLGVELMRRLMRQCRQRGVHEMWGDVLAENHAMLQLCDALGFERRMALHDPGMVRVSKDLDRDPA
jgi:acetyltransferase